MDDLRRREEMDPAKGRDKSIQLTIPYPSPVCQGFFLTGNGQQHIKTPIPLQSVPDLCIIPYEHGPVRRERDAPFFQENRRTVQGGKGGAPLPLPEGADENPRGRPLTASRAACPRQASRVATRVHRPGRGGGVSFLSRSRENRADDEGGPFPCSISTFCAPTPKK